MQISRRALLATLALGPAATAFAAPTVDSRLLVVFLRGAYDALNVLIPVDSSFYYEARPTIAIAKPGTGADAALRLGSDWGLHPALRGIHQRFLDGETAFIPFAGVEDLSRSHFLTQDIMEAANGSNAASSGFLGRLAAELSGARPIAFSRYAPIALAGSPQAPIVDLSRRLAEVSPRRLAALQAMYQESELRTPALEAVGAQRLKDELRQHEMAEVDRGASSPSSFELQARRIARVMLSGYNIGFVDVGGWDTHVNEGGAEGALATKLTALDVGLHGFIEELGPTAWQNTVIVVISEFGRTFRENGDGGTDHGHGGAYWVLGGGLKGARILGRQARLTPASLNEGRDLPVLNEHRAVFAGLFQEMYGLSSDRMSRVLPGASPLSLGMI